MDDTAILALGGDDAFEQILLKYERLIFYIARRYFTQTEDTMDACQEAALRIYKGLPKFKMPESGSLKGWVCAVTGNVCIDLLRKRKLAVEAMPEYDVSYITSESAEETVMARERALAVFKAVDALPKDHRLMIILRDMNGLSYQEIAEAAGITEGTVKSRLSRARAALKKLLT
jgi:RNA polymerase sigma-70 factor (ECF subfamily)